MSWLIYCSVALTFSTLPFASGQEISNFELLIKQGEFAKASDGLENYLRTHPKSWEAYYQLGYAEFRLHRIQQSVTALCQSILLKADFSESHKILAFDLNLLSHPELARSELKKAITLDPKSFDSNYELGRIDYEQGSYASAVSELEHARNLDPFSVKVRHNLGLAYAAAGNDNAAVESFEAGLRMNGQQTIPSAWPLIDYATYCNMRQQSKKARDLLLRAVQIDARWDRAYDELAKAYRDLHQTDDAIAALKKAIELNRKKPEYHYELSRLYAHTGRREDAKAELAEYQKVTNKPLPAGKP